MVSIYVVILQYWIFNNEYSSDKNCWYFPLLKNWERKTAHYFADLIYFFNLMLVRNIQIFFSKTSIWIVEHSQKSKSWSWSYKLFIFVLLARLHILGWDSYIRTVFSFLATVKPILFLRNFSLFTVLKTCSILEERHQ